MKGSRGDRRGGRGVLRMDVGAQESQLQNARAMSEAGRLKEAEAALRALMKRRAGDAQVYAELAYVLAMQGQGEQAKFFADHAATSRDGVALDTAARTMDVLGLVGRSLELYQRAAATSPPRGSSYNGVGVAAMKLKRLDEARAALERAIELLPEHAVVGANYAYACSETGSLEEGLRALRRAVALAPHVVDVQHQMPYLMNYSDGVTRDEVFEEHVRFAHMLGGRVAGELGEPALAVPGPGDAERTLRVGLLSADFREHSVARYLEAILREHDPARVRYTLYPCSSEADETTARLKGWAEEWSTAALGPELAAAAAIRRDRIDILIDLAGLTKGMRTYLLLARAAPVQVNYLGYPNTTGLRTMDARIVDSITDPAGAERFATERLVRLDPCFLCFAPPVGARDLPARGPAGAGPVRFASFNNLMKVTPTTLELWRRVMEGVPGSMLLLKAGALSHPGVRERVERDMARLGFDMSRVELAAYANQMRDHFGLYNIVDVGLDPFPYHGTTTTCEALYMGVPVVTLAGEAHASRVGASLMNAIGAPELIARTKDEYVEKAVALGKDAARRSAYHASLRERLMGSPLGDAPAFARRFEACLREIWRARCGGS